MASRDAVCGTANIGLGRGGPLAETTEIRLLQLAFHDCIPYVDGTGAYQYVNSNVVILIFEMSRWM